LPDIDPLDRQIVEQLTRNGRMPNLELARLTGVSEKTVRQRIRRLIERDGMRVVPVFDKTPAQSRLIVMLHSEPGQRFAVAARLAGLPEVDEVHLTTGAFELIAQASFASESEALEFYVRHIEAGEGIQSAKSAHIIESVNPRTVPVADAFEDFDIRAGEVTELRELLDLTCDCATQHLGTGRIVVSASELEHVDPESSPYRSTMRWRGLSSRYVEMLDTIRRSVSVIIPNVIERGQHLFVPDAQTDPLFARMADLVISEGFHTFLAVPVRSDDVRLGTVNLYYDTVIPYRAELVAQAQELADLVGKHVARMRHPESRKSEGREMAGSRQAGGASS
jgi:DNA-binding Lrp family transcriptional regulator